MELTLKAPTRAFLAVAKIWHEDEDLNKLTLFGPGQVGVRKAQALLEALVENPPADSLMLAAWQGTEPVGYVVVTDMDGPNKKVDLNVTIGKTHQSNGLGPRILAKAADFLFDKGVYRITFSPLKSNKPAISAASKAGWKVEARTRASVWTVDGPQDQAQMRLIKPEWGRVRKILEESDE